MGYGTRPGDFGHSIRTFEPDNTKDVLYIDTTFSSVTMKELMEKIREHFGNDSIENFDIESNYIHTDCLGYDAYDPSDYSSYLVITRTGIF
ncbi:hypothetical protein [Xanthomonas phage BUDD]|nr:hypothetical protein [Xanthomonas phage BUDD]